MKVWVLGGGSIRSAYQAGVMSCLLDLGEMPDVVIGVSGGAMNGLLLADLAGKQRIELGITDGELLADAISDFWLNNIKSENSLIKKRSKAALLYQVITKKFKGFISNEPLIKLIKNKISSEAVTASPITVSVGAVDINKGKSIYVENTSIYFIDNVIASSCIPMVFPIYDIGSYMMTDGGIINDIVKKALEYSPTELTVILNTPEDLREEIDHHNAIEVAHRTLDILLTTSINKELSRVQEINNLIKFNDDLKEKNGYFSKKFIPMRVFRPKEKLELKITNFDNDDIRNLMAQGYSDGLNDH